MNKGKPQKGTFRFLSDVEEIPQPWVMRNWLAPGITVLVGLPGSRKSTVASDIASRVSRDDLMPDGTHCEAPGGIIVIPYEESTESKVVPRMRMQGADLTRIIDLHNMHKDIYNPLESSQRKFCLPDGEQQLREAIKACHATMVIIDPFGSMAANNKRIFANQTSRELLYNLNELAMELGVAVLIVAHFTKASLKDPLRALEGPHGVGDFIRNAWMVSVDTENEDISILTSIKHNSGPKPPQIVFTTSSDGNVVKYLEGVTPEQEKTLEVQRAKTTRQAVIDLLVAHPGQKYTVQYLAQELDVKYPTMASTLRRMSLEGKITQADYGKYCATK